jgi:hypothetical protein
MKDKHQHVPTYQSCICTGQIRHVKCTCGVGTGAYPPGAWVPALARYPLVDFEAAAPVAAV